MITTEKDLVELMQRAHGVDAVSLDTEFVWERTYFPCLGLIQLALPRDNCFLIDPLAIHDLSSLGHLLADESVVKIFHDGSQDLAILQSATGAVPQNIFDTKIAAGFAGLPSTLSLLALVEKLLGVSLNKSQTRTNWLKRPLSVKQLQYGAADVRYLRSVRRLLLGEVKPEAQGWLTEELARFDNPKAYMGIPDGDRYLKVRGVNRLSRAGLAILRGLAEWREIEARRVNKPRGHVIRDEVLLSIAQSQLNDSALLDNCEGISKKSISRYGEVMVQIVTMVMAQSETTYPGLMQNGRLTKGQKGSLQKLRSWIGKQGDACGVDPALLGNKAELTAFVKETLGASRLQEGWRKAFMAGFVRN